MKYEDSASFVYGIAKRARKILPRPNYRDSRCSGLSVHRLRKSYSVQFVHTDTFKTKSDRNRCRFQNVLLITGEKDLLTSVGVGEGLFFAGLSHVVVKIVAAPYEEKLATTNPQEVRDMQERSAADHPAAAPQGVPTAQTNPTEAPSQSSQSAASINQEPEIF